MLPHTSGKKRGRGAAIPTCGNKGRGELRGAVRPPPVLDEKAQRLPRLHSERRAENPVRPITTDRIGREWRVGRAWDRLEGAGVEDDIGRRVGVLVVVCAGGPWYRVPTISSGGGPCHIRQESAVPCNVCLGVGMLAACTSTIYRW